MKKLFLCGLLALLQQVVPAQMKEVAQSKAFSTPEAGYARIFQMKNGNTIYIHFQKKGVSLHIYDKNYKEKIKQFIKPQYSKLGRHSEIKAAFEVNGDIVFF